MGIDSLTRYNMVQDTCMYTQYGVMEQDDDGEYVKFSDVKELLQTHTNNASTPCPAHHVGMMCAIGATQWKCGESACGIARRAAA